MSDQTSTIYIQNAYTYRGGRMNPWAGSLDDLRAYIARGGEWGNDPADYKIMTRTVTATPWQEVK